MTTTTPCSTNGSSPRGRGTLRFVRRVAVLVRFIPARAGNAFPARVMSTGLTVHPRAGGERCFSRCWHRRIAGSSPRGRGTPTRAVFRSSLRRFIPARAGNAGSRPARSAARTVHPRAGGERVAGPAQPVHPAGSSPRGRGTQRQRRLNRPLDRFIPARAGNADAQYIRVQSHPVHPRAGGERRDDHRFGTAEGGSSPRGRGTR